MNSDQADVFWCGYIHLSLLYSLSPLSYTLSLSLSPISWSCHHTSPVCITYIPICIFNTQWSRLCGILPTHVTIKLTHGIRYPPLSCLNIQIDPAWPKNKKQKKSVGGKCTKKTLWHESHGRMSHGWGPLFCCSSHQYLAKTN